MKAMPHFLSRVFKLSEPAMHARTKLSDTQSCILPGLRFVRECGPSHSQSFGKGLLDEVAVPRFGLEQGALRPCQECGRDSSAREGQFPSAAHSSSDHTWNAEMKDDKRLKPSQKLEQTHHRHLARTLTSGSFACGKVPGRASG